MDCDVVIVLGGGRDSELKLNTRSRARVDRALDLFSADSHIKIILSGGISFSSPAEYQKTEAEMLREYAMGKGFPSDRILLEESSTDTLGNAFFSRVEFLDPNNWRRVSVVSSEFHIPRCRYLFEKVLGDGFSVTYESTQSGYDQSKLDELEEQERHIRKVYDKWLSSIEPGDIEGVRKILFEHHPGHAVSPDYSKLKFSELLYGRDAI